MKTFWLALDLLNEPAMIEQYEQHHKKEYGRKLPLR